jgi:hypothetical protein
MTAPAPRSSARPPANANGTASDGPVLGKACREALCGAAELDDGVEMIEEPVPQSP